MTAGRGDTTPPPPDTARVEHDASGPVPLCHLDNGLVRVTLAPTLGGRVLSVRVDGREHLYHNPRLLDEDLRPRDGVRLTPTAGPMSAWNNVGGDKTWPAPQGWDGPDQWAGPPDPVLDSGAYRLITRVEDGEAIATMTSDPDPRTGLRSTRTVRLPAGTTGYRLDLEFHNVSDRRVRWGLWNVTQLVGHPPAEAGPEAGVYVGLAGSGRPTTVDLVAGTANPEVRHDGRTALVPAQDVVGKVGFPDAAGWLAHVAAHGTLTQRFPVWEEAEYPDGGSRVEVWLEHPLDRPLDHLGGLQPRDRVVECEALGPFTWLDPGDRASLPVDVRFGATRDAVTSVTDAGYWTRPLGLVTDPGTGRWRLTGVFVPDSVGALRATCHDGGGTEIAVVDHDGQRPGRPATLPELPELPPAATEIRLSVLRRADATPVDVGVVRRG
ncbi:DUF4380 domain-containing protein [Actinoalloteichus caeruleus]|uniref:DUF4380 domain-containing protein n=1 Tax=Actinoalloteichus cyanogriseus TaxID=2893586 RepID=UPI00068AE3D9|nr:DUF4380 domain-containing protein [Actinoalloteichus caeruleus]